MGKKFIPHTIHHLSDIIALTFPANGDGPQNSKEAIDLLEAEFSQEPFVLYKLDGKWFFWKNDKGFNKFDFEIKYGLDVPEDSSISVVEDVEKVVKEIEKTKWKTQIIQD